MKSNTSSFSQGDSKLDKERCQKDKYLVSQFEPGECILLSSRVMKYNHVNKQQERIIVVTDKYIYNLTLPSMLNSIFSSIVSSLRIKRKIHIKKVYGITVSRFGFEFTIHIPGEYDYRFSSIDFRDKIIQMICQAYCDYNKNKMPIFYKDEMTLIPFTTTKIDAQKKLNRMPQSQPEMLDPESFKNYDKKKTIVEMIYSKPKTKSMEKSQNYQVTIEDFTVVKVLGRGAFGKVMLCEHKATKQIYAIKSLNKEHLINKDQIEHTKTEREILTTVNHPFLVKIDYAFQTTEKLFFVMPFVRGGELFYHLKNFRRFPEEQARFYAIQLALAIGHLHEHGFIYRDLKPENILLDEFGYIQITDFGLAKKLSLGQKSKSFVGTPDYLAPEIIKNEGHDGLVDWWSLGILIFEMIVGIPPFYNESQAQMFKFIVEKEVRFPNSIPMTEEVKDIIIQLLKKQPSSRLGANGSAEIINHPWFKSINIDELMKKSMNSPFKPKLSDKFDVNNFDEEFTSESQIFILMVIQIDPYVSYVGANEKLLEQHDEDFRGMTFIQNDLIQK